PPEQPREVLEHPRLEFVHPHAAGGVRRVDAADAVDDPRLEHDLAHLFGDVRDVEAAACPEVALLLEDLHGAGESIAARKAVQSGTVTLAGPVAQRLEQRTHNP